MIVQWRNPSYCVMRIVTLTVMSLYIGLLFVGDKSTLDGAVFSIGGIFFLVFVLVIPMQAAVVPLIEDRAVLYRKTVSGTYSRISYGLGQVVADQPFHLLNTALMFVFFYFMVGFRLTAEEVVYFIIMMYMANWVIQSLGQLYALVTPNEESAKGLGGLSVILSVSLMGFLITVSAIMPDGWVWACKFECNNTLKCPYASFSNKPLPLPQIGQICFNTYFRDSLQTS
jgi:ABC-type multidrug transport system permease subunit